MITTRAPDGANNDPENRKNRKTQNFKSLKKNDRQGVKELILRVLYKRKFLLKKLQGAAWGHTPPLHLMYNKYVGQ